MAVPDHHRHRNVYHFTSVENLESIIDTGLLSTNQKISRRISHVNVADEGIQGRRALMQVPGTNGCCVHDYVPFYFAKKTPMQLAVLHKKNVDQQFIIYLSVSILSLETRIGSYFTDASANTAIPPTFYSGNNQANQLDVLNWTTIDNDGWRYADDAQRHQKMAELLLPDHVPLCAINQIITWDRSISDVVRSIYQGKGVGAPNIVEGDFKHYYHQPGNWTSSLVTGPVILKKLVDEAIEHVASFQRGMRPKFQSIGDALTAIRGNFSAIQELDDIDGLDANYGPHHEDVGSHSRRVAGLVVNSPEFHQLDLIDQEILELAAYLHDIGKGPKTRWVDNYMHEADGEHPKKSLPMLQRILTEDLPAMQIDIVRKIMMLVTYDDLLGEIVVRGRNKNQLFNIVTSSEDINMLVALSKADIGSLNAVWLARVSDGIDVLREEVLQRLQENGL
ncbi:DarT ssDNA thymidine ADP-ribosyltransferase family protein [Pectobacterium sp. CHL-2024]|uniref:DarT ssDNA thymidine ADP-ribosyltransferase family protein n=1 Tax=Pectobacterium TaxID=122277 RepID=UPI002A83F992|nr:DarT ssDNA thymidine ADP-ribosyltransferase family protein [Pectobacterium brasiliense]MDY4324205.1 DarT ssDNA thymidine ADP-ribosyltransferase family protein [Pectobacterium brasiliense]